MLVAEGGTGTWRPASITRPSKAQWLGVQGVRENAI